MNNLYKRIIGISMCFLTLLVGLAVKKVEAADYYDEDGKYILCSSDINQYFTNRISFKYVDKVGDKYHYKLKIKPIGDTNKCEKMITDDGEKPILFDIVKGQIPTKYDANGNVVESYDAESVYSGLNGEALPPVKCNKEVDIYASELDDDPDGGDKALVIGLKPRDEGLIISSSGSCIVNGTQLYYISSGSPSDPDYDSEQVEIDEISYTTGGLIDCDKEYAPWSFEDRFCNAKNKAIAANNSFKFDKGKYDKAKPQSFSCSYKSEDIVLPSSANGYLNGESYFANKNYLYGVSTTSVSSKYTYHYAPGYSVNENVKCDLTCEEAVEVEYGLPVASKAGLCFEYKVRVTSRVSCKIKDKITPPKSKINYCTPYPICKSQQGDIYDQGGPNEDFDDCVQNCDGGKYTQKCSNKCYVEVYGSIAAGAKASFSPTDNLPDRETDALVNGGDISSDYHNDNNNACWGYYAYGEKGSKVWHPAFKDKDPSYKSAGRWYCTSNWGAKTYPSRKIYSVSGDDGFFRRKYTSGYCNDKCTWNGCDKGSGYYINKYVPCTGVGYDATKSKWCGSGDGKEGRTYTYTYGDKTAKVDYVNIARYDLEKNMAEYERLVNSCNARVKCSETTSYYTISATYGQNGVSETTQVDFPGSGAGDYARATNNGSENSVGDKQTTLFINYPSQNKGLSGCYNIPNTLHPGNGSSEGHITDLYRTTWGFPGSWINLKTGEVSYTGNGVNAEPGWKLYSGKFCLPNNARDVNTDWYDAYRSKELFSNGDSVWNNPGVIGSSAMNEEVIKKCYQYTFITNSVPNFRVSSVDYNIIAHAIDFGYFNWDIDIKCFYALHSRPFNSTPTTDEEELKCIPSENNYRVHASDPINLFPSSDGSDITNTNDSGRLVGFNWSEYAVNTKNPDYISDPPKLMEKIQSIAKAGNTYSDDYLDYQFYLSPGNIRELRKASYSPFSDSGFDISENGIVHYKSEFIRNSKYFSNIVVPQGKNVNCNNIDKLSGGCLKLD